MVNITQSWAPWRLARLYNQEPNEKQMWRVAYVPGLSLPPCTICFLLSLRLQSPPQLPSPAIGQGPKQTTNKKKRKKKAWHTNPNNLLHQLCIILQHEVSMHSKHPLQATPLVWLGTLTRVLFLALDLIATSEVLCSCHTISPPLPNNPNQQFRIVNRRHTPIKYQGRSHHYFMQFPHRLSGHRAHLCRDSLPMPAIFQASPNLYWSSHPHGKVMAVRLRFVSNM